jgi:serine/threonine protein kinase
MADLTTSGDMPAPSEAARADWPIVPGYEILAELGRGGMGVVYKARQTSSQRLVALKMIRDSALAGPQERARFRIEAEAGSRMRHPNLVEIYEVGEHAGRAWFAMELVEGGGLDQHLAGRPQPARQAADLIRTLARAVQHAHDQQIVHRDLKPANILLAAGALPAIPKITDFGLAKRLDSDSTALTRDGAVVGTANYMAPEQAAGRVGEIGPAVDVYALGAILYEMLTGRPPLEADAWDRTIQQVLHADPTPPTRLQPDVPPALETVCLKCLEKEPGRRYARAGDLADDLDRFLGGQAIVAVAPGAQERLARLAARDGYQIVAEVARGPRSIVYHARYDPLQQPVALKVFRAGAVSREEWDTRLRRGAELWAALAHPQIVPVQRAGWWDGAAYVALEYVPHGSLAAKVDGQAHRVSKVLGLVEQLAEIVRYLHRQGVVHGNLKPSNVLLAADGIPRVSDLRLCGGLFLGPRSEADEDAAGLRYLPPEHVQDPGAEPRPFTDIYGLGLILYELLAGRPVFAGATAQATLEQVRTAEPAPLTGFNPEVTPHLEMICQKCLRKNPWHRYTRTFDLLRLLRHCRAELEGQAASDPQRPKRRSSGLDDLV